MPTLPEHAQVVIVGGGIVGTSTAYHLAKLGISDVVLLEQGKLTCGTTWHAAGLVGQTRATRNATRMSQYGIELYSTLEQETSLATGWKQCGSLNVAKTPERMQLIKRQMARAKSFGIAFDYDARTVATYDDVIAPERTVMVGGPETARSVPNTGPQKSLKLGADGSVAVLEPPPTAPIAVAPPAAVPATMPTAPTPTIAMAVPAAAVTEPATPPGSTAMDELLKRRKASIEAPASSITPRVATKAAPPPMPPTVSAAVVPVPAGVAITPPSTTAASAGPAPASGAITPGASAWQKANAHTQFQE